jgi:uncharacterized membrane-anchored protein YitT (DUF2179 family)
VKNRKKGETMGFKDLLALSLAILRILLPKLLITLLALFLSGIVITHILG